MPLAPTGDPAKISCVLLRQGVWSGCGSCSELIGFNQLSYGTELDHKDAGVSLGVIG